jgi:hypothetical protein
MSNYLSSLSIILYLACLPSFFFNWKKINHPGFNLIVVYTFVIWCSDTLLHILSKYGIHNHLVVSIYTLVACILLLQYYLKKGTAFSARWIYLLMALCGVIWTIELLFIDNLHAMNTEITYTLLSAIIIILSVTSLINRKNRIHQYSRWVDTTLLLFLGITIVISSCTSLGPIKVPLVYRYLYWIQLSANLTYSIILIIGAWKKVEQ